MVQSECEFDAVAANECGGGGGGGEGQVQK